MPLLRQAREAASSAESEASALRAEVEEMAAELRRLRLQQVAEAERAAAANMTCELCFDEASAEQSGSLTCPNQHFVCADCSPQMVTSFLERVSASDTMLEDHRTRSGLVPCVHANPAFQDPCAAHYTDQALARALPNDVFVGYRAAQDATTENRLWQHFNQRFQEEVLHAQQQLERQQAAHREERASTDFLRRQYPNARMCPQCRCGPVINENCFDLQAHHNQASGRSRISNACRQCGFFTRDWNQWLPWDGVIRGNG